MLRKLEIALTQHVNAEHAVRWLSEALSTITSNVITELTISIPPFPAASEYRVRAWNPVDDVLYRFSRRADVTLVVRTQYWVGGHEFEGLIKKYLPLMWKNGRVVLEVLHDMDDEVCDWLEVEM